MLVNNFLNQSAEQLPNKEALLSNNKKLTFLEIEKAANSLANALIFHGLQRQERAAIFLENHNYHCSDFCQLLWCFGY